MDEYLLVLNAGSSSLKFCVFQRQAECWRLSSRGQVESIANEPRLFARDDQGNTLVNQSIQNGDSFQAAGAVAEWLRAKYSGGRVLAVGQRVVHGGAEFTGPAIVTPRVVTALQELVSLAPLHQPHCLAAIEAVWKFLPRVPQVACFDTSFHRSRPPVAQLVPLPLELREAGLERYGFHGLSYEFIVSAMEHVAPGVANGRVIVAHLGSGASMCAIRAGKSLDSTFGFTALDGLCMATRSGALDPGVVLHLFQKLKLSAGEVETLLYKKSGLLGISGSSSDMRKLVERTDAQARLAVDYFVYRAAKEMGALAAVLGGVDALVFTAGIGENSAIIRQRICRASAWLGIDLDDDANQRGDCRLSNVDSPISVFVIPTNEELAIARHTTKLLGLPLECIE